jgi:hypothetical protein
MRYFIGLILVVILIFLSFHFVFKSHPKAPVIKPVDLTSYASTDTVVQYSTEGVINADTLHRTEVITIGKTQSTISIIQGYNGFVLKSNSIPNNQNSYNAFLHALALEGYANSKKSAITDTTSICPTGQRSYYKIISGSGTELQNLWSASCVTGTFGGDTAKVQGLFQVQIPNYSLDTNNVNLN